jgi:hypothetical protein
MINARNVDELFEAVPKLQSCARGVKLVHDKLPLDTEQTNELKHTVSLQNRKKLYVYVERSCPELNEIAELLRNIKSY